MHLNLYIGSSKKDKNSRKTQTALKCTAIGDQKQLHIGNLSKRESMEKQDQ